MRVLTVRQPWSAAIMSGHKTVENRSRNIAGDYRGPVAIHAGLREDLSARNHSEIQRWARDYWGASASDVLVGRRDQFGHIVGVVDLVDVHHWSDCLNGVFGCSPWAMSDCYHLVLACPRAIEPIPYKGALGLRTITDPAVLAKLGGAR